MEITALCVVASLRLIISSSQCFFHASLTLRCTEQEDASEWRVKRNTSKHTDKECSKEWGNRNESHCFIDDLYRSDTGVYWCESAAGECSDAINITVTAGSVILESPIFPVPEGKAVTLRCTGMPSNSSNPTAEFYKDGRLIESSSTGNMTIQSISKSDEGLYRCSIAGSGESPESWLAVRGDTALPPESPRLPLVHILLPVVGVCLLLLSVLVLRIWRSCKGEIGSGVSYTDIVITQEPARERETESTTTIYTTVMTRTS